MSSARRPTARHLNKYDTQLITVLTCRRYLDDIFGPSGLVTRPWRHLKCRQTTHRTEGTSVLPAALRHRCRVFVVRLLARRRWPRRRHGRRRRRWRGPSSGNFRAQPWSRPYSWPRSIERRRRILVLRTAAIHKIGLTFLYTPTVDADLRGSWCAYNKWIVINQQIRIKLIIKSTIFVDLFCWTFFRKWHYICSFSNDSMQSALAFSNLRIWVYRPSEFSFSLIF